MVSENARFKSAICDVTKASSDNGPSQVVAADMRKFNIRRATSHLFLPGGSKQRAKNRGDQLSFGIVTDYDKRF